MRSAVVVGAVGLACVLVVVGAGVPTRASAETALHAAWAGRFVLDKKKSDPPTRMLEAMEVPWYVKPLASVFTPTFDIKSDGDGLELATTTPLGSRVVTLHGDDIEYPGEDQLGRPFRERSLWTKDGALDVVRMTDLPSGKIGRVESHWHVQGDTLTNDMSVQVGEASPFTVKRVFEREPKSD